MFQTVSQDAQRQRLNPDEGAEPGNTWSVPVDRS